MRTLIGDANVDAVAASMCQINNHTGIEHKDVNLLTGRRVGTLRRRVLARWRRAIGRGCGTGSTGRWVLTRRRRAGVPLLRRVAGGRCGVPRLRRVARCGRTISGLRRVAGVGARRRRTVGTGRWCTVWHAVAWWSERATGTAHCNKTSLRLHPTVNSHSGTKPRQLHPFRSVNLSLTRNALGLRIGAVSLLRVARVSARLGLAAMAAGL